MAYQPESEAFPTNHSELPCTSLQRLVSTVICDVELAVKFVKFVSGGPSCKRATSELTQIELYRQFYLWMKRHGCEEYMAHNQKSGTGLTRKYNLLTFEERFAFALLVVEEVSLREVENVMSATRGEIQNILQSARRKLF